MRFLPSGLLTKLTGLMRLQVPVAIIQIAVDIIERTPMQCLLIKQY